MSEHIGDLARSMAAAPLSELDELDIPDTSMGVALKDAARKAVKERKVKQAATVENTLDSFFGTPVFKPVGKLKEYPNEDGSVTVRLADALIPIGNSGIVFRTRIYRQSRIVATGTNQGKREVETYCALPSTGKGFPQPVFHTDDPNVQSQLDAWRYGIAQQFKAWRLATSGNSKITVSANVQTRIVDYEDA